MSQNDPDPNLPDEGHGRAELGGKPAPDAGDPTQGGRRGQIGDAPSIAEDEPDDGGPGYPVGGGDITEHEGGRVADPDPAG